MDNSHTSIYYRLSRRIEMQYDEDFPNNFRIHSRLWGDLKSHLIGNLLLQFVGRLENLKVK